ncbi:uncharacterized protein BJX67DRAFT_307198 [Aspergillus lucknowensis]|uniref:Uncharacterized protein n=1 Tax=Aspergillus lucknowensis TaxID=176173 RepID=A0ABR4M044_9EURO
MDDFHLVRGTFTFSSSLRSRPIWKVIGPVLTASATRIEGQLHYSQYSSPNGDDRHTEEQSQPNDITFRPETGAQNLQILLLTPSSLEPSQKQDLILRLRQFAASDPSSCVKKAIAFLLSEEAFVSANGKYSLDGLFALQVMYALYN